MYNLPVCGMQTELERSRLCCCDARCQGMLRALMAWHLYILSGKASQWHAMVSATHRLCLPPQLDTTAGGGRPLPQLDETADGQGPWRHHIWKRPSSWLSTWLVCGKALLGMSQPLLHPGHCTVWIREQICAAIPEVRLPAGFQEQIW